MSTLADRSIAALRSVHDDLAALVPTLTDEQLSGPSGASEWTVAQVLSHLGSGAEIALAGYRAALAGEAAPGQSFNESVWDRWNALGERAQADAFLEHDAVVVQELEALTSEQREATRVTLAFLPAPLSLGAAVGLRLNEAALHAWDVRVAVDPAADLDPHAAPVLVEHFTAELAPLLGFLGKADQLGAPAVVRLGDTDVSVVVDDGVALRRDAGEPTARFEGGPGPALRLLSGRLRAPYVPAGVRVTGGVTLDELQRVFPGF